MINMTIATKVASISDGDASMDNVTHSNAATALDIVLHYIEQHAATMPNGIMFMRCWRNIQSSGKFMSLHQMKITDFK